MMESGAAVSCVGSGSVLLAACPFVVEMRVAVIDGGRAFVRRRTAALTKNLAEPSRSAQTIWMIKNSSLENHYGNASSQIVFRACFYCIRGLWVSRASSPDLHFPLRSSSHLFTDSSPR